MGPLAGFRVLDLTSVIMGPYATQLLGDMGADVITLERAEGDTNRVMGPGPHPQFSGVALNIARNKRNVLLDIKHPEGYAVLVQLIRRCDAVITNFRPAVLARARLTYDEVRAIRDDIVFCQAHGYPSDSPRADDPAYDDVIQAATGMADATRRASGTPALAPTIFADKVCALTIVYSVVAALLRRERTGRGEHIEIPMVDAMTAFMLVEHGSGGISLTDDFGAGYPRVLSPERRPQPTADGWIGILPYSAAHYDALFAEGCPELVGDARYATGRRRIENSDFLYEQVRSVLITRTTGEWLAFCARNEIPATAVRTFDELVDELPIANHPLVGPYRHIPFPVRFAEAGEATTRPAPTMGQDTDEVLGELGLTPAEIGRLRDTGVIPEPRLS